MQTACTEYFSEIDVEEDISVTSYKVVTLCGGQASKLNGCIW